MYIKSVSVSKYVNCARHSLTPDCDMSGTACTVYIRQTWYSRIAYSPLVAHPFVGYVCVYVCVCVCARARVHVSIWIPFLSVFGLG